MVWGLSVVVSYYWCEGTTGWPEWSQRPLVSSLYATAPSKGTKPNHSQNSWSWVSLTLQKRPKKDIYNLIRWILNPSSFLSFLIESQVSEFGCTMHQFVLLLYYCYIRVSELSIRVSVSCQLSVIYLSEKQMLSPETQLTVTLSKQQWTLVKLDFCCCLKRHRNIAPIKIFSNLEASSVEVSFLP